MFRAKLFTGNLGSHEILNFIPSWPGYIIFFPCVWNIFVPIILLLCGHLAISLQILINILHYSGQYYGIHNITIFVPAILNIQNSVVGKWKFVIFLLLILFYCCSNVVDLLRSLLCQHLCSSRSFNEEQDFSLKCSAWKDFSFVKSFAISKPPWCACMITNDG